MWTELEQYKYEAIRRQKEAARHRAAAEQIALNKKARRDRQS